MSSTPASTSPPKLADPAEFDAKLIPTLSQIFHHQSAYPGQFDPEVVKDIFYHACKYPQQTTYGFLIGQTINDKLHIVEAVPISHTQHLPPPLFESALEITSSRVAKSVDISKMREIVLSTSQSPQSTQPCSNAQLQPSTPSPQPQLQPTPSHNNTITGITNNALMDQIEDLFKQDSQHSQSSTVASGKDFQNPDLPAQTSFSSPELFFSGLYICPSPTPKLSESVVDVLRRFHEVQATELTSKTQSTNSQTPAPTNPPIVKPTQDEYNAAKATYLHASLRSIPYPLIKNVIDLTNVCPNPTLTILDPILLNILTNAYDSHRASKSTQTFTPQLPSLLTYFLHDDVIMTPLDELLTSSNIHQLLFFDMLQDHPEESTNQPTTTTLDPQLFTQIMTDVGNRLHMTLIDWQEASGES